MGCGIAATFPSTRRTTTNHAFGPPSENCKSFNRAEPHGKWKLNQNHPVERRRKVVRALQQRGDENTQAVAAMMQVMLPSED